MNIVYTRDHIYHSNAYSELCGKGKEHISNGAMWQAKLESADYLDADAPGWYVYIYTIRNIDQPNSMSPAVE